MPRDCSPDFTPRAVYLCEEDVHAQDGTRFYIITEADRSVITVLLPEDY